jgi:hypothetical protein
VCDTLEAVEFRVVRSGRRHKIGNRHILEAMVDAGEPTPIRDQLHYLGTDSRGIELEIIAVPDDRNPGGLAVIHAMPAEFREPGEEDDPA